MNIQLDAVIPLLHEATFGILATQSTHLPGYPFSSILPFALDEHHCPVFLISALAEHTKNLVADYRTSLLVSNADAQNVLTSARLTLIGDVEKIDPSQEMVARYLRYQPDAKQYLELGGFGFFRLRPKRIRYIAGFGEMGWLSENEFASGAVLPLDAEEILYKELIQVLPFGIRLLGVDCYGVDIERQGQRERQQFPNAPIPVENALDAIKRFVCAL
jgi:hypothetical protein